MQTVDSGALAPGASNNEKGVKWGSGGVLGKRSADESKLNDEDRFAKRLNRLSLDYHDLRHPAGNNTTSAITTANALEPPLRQRPSSIDTSTPFAPRLDPVPCEPPRNDELMQIDDTRDRVYIHDLDEELADIEASEEEERLIFLPDIERHFSKIPQSVLGGRSSEHDGEGQQMVLYGAPKSLTVDESHDSVRKAIIESRQRARDKAALEARVDDMNWRYAFDKSCSQAEIAHGYSAGYGGASEWVEPDPDAMEIE